ncbi:hypothetical protein NHX12_018106, partial [Muraenolepis orangiensis]
GVVFSGKKDLLTLSAFVDNGGALSVGVEEERKKGQQERRLDLSPRKPCLSLTPLNNPHLSDTQLVPRARIPHHTMRTLTTLVLLGLLLCSTSLIQAEDAKDPGTEDVSPRETALEPDYAEAATTLKGAELAVIRLAKVEATEEQELAEEFQVAGFPTLKLFVDGDRKNPVDFKGQRTAQGIVQWMLRRSGPSPVVLETPNTAAEFINSHNITVVGFFKVSVDLMGAEFAMTSSPAVMEMYEGEASSVVLFKKLDGDDLKDFIEKNSLELIIPFNKQDYRTVAKEFKGKVLFVTLDVTAGYSQVLRYFGLSEADAPTVRIINNTAQVKYAMGAGEITAATLRLFCQGVLDGTLK